MTPQLIHRRLFLFPAIVLFLLLSNYSFSQDSLLTIQQAIEISLKNNYDIRIAKNINEQQENNNTIGNAGMLPNADLNGTYVRSSYSLNQKYNTGAEVNRDATKATTSLADAGIVYTIFNGTKMFSAKKELSQIALQSRDQLKIQVENTLLNLITTYYSIVRQQQLLNAIREELKFSEERVKIAERKMNNGLGSRLEWLQTKTDFNRQHAEEIRLMSDEDGLRVSLNQQMGRKIEINFSTEDTVVVSYSPAYDDLKKTVSQNNNELNYYNRSRRIAELELDQVRSLRSPVLSVNAHYVYSKNTSEAGFTLFNKINGFNYGATATIPLFHGFNINRQIRNSKLDVHTSGIEYESATARVEAGLFNAWREFQNNIVLLKIEEENISFAREVFSISQERYRIGVSNVVEQRDAQRTFEEAMSRLADARYNAKISEMLLRKLNGGLVSGTKY